MKLELGLSLATSLDWVGPSSAQAWVFQRLRIVIYGGGLELKSLFDSLPTSMLYSIFWFFLNYGHFISALLLGLFILFLEILSRSGFELERGGNMKDWVQKNSFGFLSHTWIIFICLFFLYPNSFIEHNLGTIMTFIGYVFA